MCVSTDSEAIMNFEEAANVKNAEKSFILKKWEKVEHNRREHLSQQTEIGMMKVYHVFEPLAWFDENAVSKGQTLMI